MDLTDIRQLYEKTDAYAGKEVTVGGWIRNIRDSKSFGFVVLNDGTYFSPLQIVYDNHLDNFEEISAQNVGAALIATGEIVLTPDAKQPFEMQAKEVVIEGASDPKYPLQPKRHTMEFLPGFPVRLPILFSQTFSASFSRKSMFTQFSSVSIPPL